MNDHPNAEAVICEECPTPIQWNVWRRQVVAKFQRLLDENSSFTTRLAAAEADLKLSHDRYTKLLNHCTSWVERAESAEQARDLLAAEVEAIRYMDKCEAHCCQTGYEGECQACRALADIEAAREAVDAAGVLK